MNLVQNLKAEPKTMGWVKMIPFAFATEGFISSEDIILCKAQVVAWPSNNTYEVTLSDSDGTMFIINRDEFSVEVSK